MRGELGAASGASVVSRQGCGSPDLGAGWFFVNTGAVTGGTFVPSLVGKTAKNRVYYFSVVDTVLCGM